MSKFHRRSFSIDRNVVPARNCHDMFALDTALPHARARDPSRQLEIPERRCKLFLSILCGVACDVWDVLQEPAHVFVTCLVIFWWQLVEYFSSCWSVEVRSSHVNLCRNFPPRSPLAISDSTTLSASSDGVDADSSGLACVLHSFATHLARTLGFPCWSPPILSALWRLSCTSCGDDRAPPLHVLVWRRPLGQATRLCCHANATHPTS